MRMLAAEYGKPLGPDEIARRSGLSRSTVQRISARKSWKGVSIDVAVKFASGCGFRFGDIKPLMRRLKYVERNGIAALKHLQVTKRAPLWKRGANANTKKFLIRIITSDE
jgi:hypothetical protein